jgi:pimeloyl-ACP methyl ester carboxylesterase/predicted glycosyltransferase
MRARYPDAEGYVERDGVKIFYEVYGEEGPTIVLLPTWSIIHSRHWKGQIPYFARGHRVVTFDPRGNGRSDRPQDPLAYEEDEFAADAVAVMDETDTEKAMIVSLSKGALRALVLAAEHPDRVEGAVFIGPAVPLTPPSSKRAGIKETFWEELDSYEGWAKYNANYWVTNYRDFLEFFFSQMFSEPHSTKQIEDCVGWGLETTGEDLVIGEKAPRFTRERCLELCARVRCPVLVIHGSDDEIIPHQRGEALAEATGGTLVTLAGAGHGPHARDPVKANLLIKEFVDGPDRRSTTWTRGRSRLKRALFVCSPIGLGHAQRDVAISKELKQLVPDLDVQWLAQDPVTRVLEQEGETIHPASRFLANESKHIESESAEHDLHCFQAWRNMDEILVANFMLFHDVVNDEAYDLWIGDEAWEVDYYLHENPEQKRAAYGWLTDFVGWLPMPDGGDREAALTTDYNAEMIEHIARYPRIRDRAIFVGDPEDIVPSDFGPGLPPIRDWTEQHYDFSGYVTGFGPESFADVETIRHELEYLPDEKVCIVTVGGSGVGEHLLRRVIEAYPAAKAQVPELRMIVVAGPRIDPATLPQESGLEIRPYVHNLYRHLAVCDLAVVQGGLTTSMELTANRRPFLYFPLRHHFEQNFHVRHRLDRYGSGRRMDFDTATPEVIAEAIAGEIGTDPSPLSVDTEGAKRAARLLADLL